MKRFFIFILMAILALGIGFGARYLFLKSRRPEIPAGPVPSPQTPRVLTPEEQRQAFMAIEAERTGPDVLTPQEQEDALYAIGGEKDIPSREARLKDLERIGKE